MRMATSAQVRAKPDITIWPAEKPDEPGGMWLEHEGCPPQLFPLPRFVNGGHCLSEDAEFCTTCKREVMFDPGAEW